MFQGEIQRIQRVSERAVWLPRTMWGSVPILMVCVGAVPWSAASLGYSRPPRSTGRGKITPFAGLGRVVALMLLVASPCLEAVTCDTCKDTIGGCTGGASCPLLKDPTDNAEALASSSSTVSLDVTKLLPPELLCTFTKTVMETLSAVARAPKGGGSVDLGSSSISAATGVVKAAINGFCTWEEAGLELAGRLEAASSDAEVTKLSAALTLLKATADKAGNVAQAAVQSGMGLYTFVWAKIGAHLDAVQAGTVRILAKSAGSASASDLTAKVRRPQSESEFHYMVFLFIRIMAALGISLYLVHDFLAKVVFNTMHHLAEDYKVAHELLLIYFRAIETDILRTLHFGNVFDRGSSDTYLSEARQNAATFFRPRAGNAQPIGDKKVKWNGKSTPASKKPCVAFNLEKEHLPAVLDATGCCKFSHTCMQWVSDKGSRGMCGGDHAKLHCDYDAAKKRDTPLP